MDSLVELITEHQNWLVEHVQAYAQEQGFTRYKPTGENSCQPYISEISAAFVQYLHTYEEPPELHPEDPLEPDSANALGQKEARRYRYHGIALNVFLGLMKYYRRVYMELILQAGYGPEKIETYRKWVERFFDHLEISLNSEWLNLSEEDKLVELQTANQYLTQTNHKYRSIFENLQEPVILLNEQDQVEDFNSAAANLLGEAPLERYPDEQDPLCQVIIPWMEPVIKAYRANGQRESIFEKEISTPEGERLIRVELKPLPNEGENQKSVMVTLNDITDLMSAQENALQRLNQINSSNEIDQAITSFFDLRATLALLLDRVVKQLEVDAADILLVNPENSALECPAWKGFRLPPMRRFNDASDMLANRVIREKNLVSFRFSDVANRNNFKNPDSSVLLSEGFAIYYGVPLLSKGVLRGVLEVFKRSIIYPDPLWLDLLETLARQAAIAIENTQLFEELQKKNQALSYAYHATIEGWSRTLDLHDHGLEGHSNRLADLCTQMAQTLGINSGELDAIRWGALLHDIGQLFIPHAILTKPDVLTVEERSSMQRHTEYARDFLSSISFLRSAADIPYAHHERWNGAGYPRGLLGKSIPLSARIFAVADVWDSMLSARPYRPAFSTGQTLAYLREQSGILFETALVDTFIQIVNKNKNRTIFMNNPLVEAK